MNNKCECCGYELEPIVQDIHTPSYDDGGGIDSIEVESVITGYFPCEGCDLDKELIRMISEHRAQEILEDPYNEDDLPW